MIDGKPANDVVEAGRGTDWEATRVMQSGDTEDLVGFLIDYQDIAGNSGLSVSAVKDTSSVTFDETAPTVQEVSSTTANGTYSTGAQIALTVRFSEPVSVDTGGGTPQLALVIDAARGTKYADYLTGAGGDTLTFQYTVAEGDMTTELAYTGTGALSANGGAIRDAAGNDAALTLPTPGAANSLSANRDIAIDTDMASVTSVSSGSASGPYGVGQAINVKVTFSEAVTLSGDGATLDVALDSGGTVSIGTFELQTTVQGSYTVAAGHNSPDLAASSITVGGGGTLEDGGGNDVNLAVPSSNISSARDIVVDTTKPSVTIARADAQPDPSNSANINFKVTFSEDVTGFESGDVNVSGTANATTAVVSPTGPASVYNVTVTGMTGDGAVTITFDADDALDAANNGNEIPAIADNSVEYDATAPTVSTVGAAVDPINDGALTQTVTVTFGEDMDQAVKPTVKILGVTTEKTDEGNGVWNSPTEYQVAIALQDDNEEDSALDVEVSLAKDLAGNTQTLYTENNPFSVDTKNPTPEITLAPGQADPTGASPVVFRVTFDEPVSDFADADIDLGGTAGANAVVVTAADRGATYDVEVSGMTQNGTVIITFEAGDANDLANNPSAAPTLTDNSVAYETTPPEVSNVTFGADPVSDVALSQTVTITYNEPMEQSVKPTVKILGVTTEKTDVDGGVWNSATEYQVAIAMADDNEEDGTLTVETSLAQDLAGNVQTLDTRTNPFSVDTLNPTATITRPPGQPDPTKDSPITFTVTFSETVTGFDAADVSIVGDTGADAKVVTPAGPAAVYSVKISGMTQDGEVNISFAAGAATDLAGNASAAPTLLTDAVDYDTTAPQATSVAASVSQVSDAARDQTITVGYNEPMDKSVKPMVKLLGITTEKTDEGSGAWDTPGTEYQVTITLADDDEEDSELQVEVTLAQDLAGNVQTTRTESNPFSIDTRNPSAEITRAAGQLDPTNDVSIEFTVTFSESVTGFADGDIVVSGDAGATTPVVTPADRGAVYTVAVTGMTGDGAVSISFAAGAAQDAAGNGAAAPTLTEATVTYDVTPPQVDNIAFDTNPVSDAALAQSITITYDEPMDQSVRPTVKVLGVKTPITEAGSGAWNSATQFQVTVTLNDDDEEVSALDVEVSLARDLAGNPQTIHTASNPFTVDTKNPTAEVTKAVGQNDPTKDSPIEFLVTFSESVTGFASGDIQLSGTAGATTSVVTPLDRGASYGVAVSGMTGDGTVTISFSGNVVQDAAGNVNVPPTLTEDTVNYDATPPEVSNVAASVATVSDGALDQTITIAYGEDMDQLVKPTVRILGIVTEKMDVAGGAWNGAREYVVTITLADDNEEDGELTVETSLARDVAGNVQAVHTATNPFAVDTKNPSAEIAKAANQLDPAKDSPIVFTVTFSEAVTGFDSGDVTVSGTAGATTPAVTPLDRGVSYSVAVTGMTGDGTVSISFAAGAAQDAAGNASLASPLTGNTVTYDASVPEVQSLAVTVDPISDSALTQTVTVTYGEAMDQTIMPTVSILGITNEKTDTGSGTWTSGTTYQVAIQLDDDNEEDSELSVRATAAQDLSGRVQGPYTEVNAFTVDTRNPTAEITLAPGQANPTKDSPVAFLVTFSESVTGFDASDIAISGGAGATTATVTAQDRGAVYRVEITGMTAAGEVNITFAAGAALDAAGNGNAAPTLTAATVNYDGTPPQVSGVAVSVNPVNDGARDQMITVTYNEDMDQSVKPTVRVLGITTEKTDEGNGAWNLPTQYQVIITLDDDEEEDSLLDVEVSLARDLAGNEQVLYTETNPFTIDTRSPTAAIARAPGQASPTNGSPISFTVTFSESVTGFASADVQITGTTGADTAVVTPAGPGAVFQVAVSGMTAEGDVSITFAAGVAGDAADNPNAAPQVAPEVAVHYDPVAPSLTSVSIASNNANPAFAKANDTIILTFVANEPLQTPSVLIDSSAAQVASTGRSTSWQATYTMATGTSGAEVTFSINFADIAGNAGGPVTQVTGDSSVTFDNVAPTVQSVSSPLEDGAYTTNARIEVEVIFSEPVLAGVDRGGASAPALTLETGDTDRDAVYESGSDTATLKLVYTVVDGDVAADLDYVAAGSLTGSGVTDRAGNPAVLALAAPGQTGSLGDAKNIEIATTTAGFTVVELTLPFRNGAASKAIGVNSAGQVIGCFQRTEPGAWGAFLYDPNGGRAQFTEILPSSDFVAVSDINDKGLVAGYKRDAAGDPTRAFVWALSQEGSQMMELAHYDAPATMAYGVNDAATGDDQVVGLLESDAGRRYAGIWAVATGRGRDGTAPDGGTTEDGGATGGAATPTTQWSDQGIACGVNSRGWVVGQAETTLGDWHAFFWPDPDEPMIDLDPAGVGRSRAAAVSNGEGGSAAQIVGHRIDEVGAMRAFRCTVSETRAAMPDALVDLSALGGVASSAADVNNDGRAVGWAETVDGELHAALWGENWVIDLNEMIPPSSGWVLESAAAISDSGLIVGWGRQGENRMKAFLLNRIDPDANMFPSVRVVDPIAGTALAEAGGVRIIADAMDVDGGVDRVTFYAQEQGQEGDGPEQQIGVVSGGRGSVFEVTWTGFTPGVEYAVYARVRDDQGAVRESAAVVVTVVAGNEYPFRLIVRTGWNLFSIPVLPADNSVATLLGAVASSPVYDWGGAAYTEAEFIVPKKAYWMYHAGPEVIVEIVGVPVGDVTRAVGEGWSLIGSVAAAPYAPFEPDWLVNPAPGAIPPKVFRYGPDGAYYPSGVLECGLGYWLYMTTGATITLGAE